MARSYRAAIVTVSDSVAGGTREDASGPAVVRILQSSGWTIKSTEILPDDFSLLRERLGALAADVEADAVFTTGGTGIGPRDRDASSSRGDEEDAADLYRALEETIVPLYHGDLASWAGLMRTTIALNGSFFNTQRMLQEYVVKAYRNAG